MAPQQAGLTARAEGAAVVEVLSAALRRGGARLAVNIFLFKCYMVVDALGSAPCLCVRVHACMRACVLVRRLPSTPGCLPTSVGPFCPWPLTRVVILPLNNALRPVRHTSHEKPACLSMVWLMQLHSANHYLTSSECSLCHVCATLTKCSRISDSSCLFSRAQPDAKCS